jgi:hypothetical protein
VAHADIGSPADEMPRAGVLNTDHVASLPKGYVGDLITTLGSERLAEVCRALDRATGCWHPRGASSVRPSSRNELCRAVSASQAEPRARPGGTRGSPKLWPTPAISAADLRPTRSLATRKCGDPSCEHCEPSRCKTPAAGAKVGDFRTRCDQWRRRELNPRPRSRERWLLRAYPAL